MDEFTKPFLVSALAAVKESKSEVKSDEDHGDTLLAHLVHHTEGWAYILNNSDGMLADSTLIDINVLKDEVRPRGMLCTYY